MIAPGKGDSGGGRLLLIWVVLAAGTLISVSCAESAFAARPVTAIVFALAVFKGQLVAAHFMEVRSARLLWRRLYPLWIGVIGMALLVATMLAPAG